MLRKYKLFCLMLPPLLLLSCLLSACQASIVPSITPPVGGMQVQACQTKSLPVLKTLEPVQVTAQTIYASSGPNLYAFDAGNGTTRWCQTTLLNTNSDQIDSLSGDGNNLYATTDSGHIITMDTIAGNLRWSAQASDTDTQQIPPVITGQTVYAGFQQINAFKIENGNMLWKYPLSTERFLNAPPMTMNGVLYFGTDTLDTEPDQIYALDATTGKKLWTYSFPQGIVSNLYAAAGQIFFSVGYPWANNNQLGAIDGQSGKLLWEKSFTTETPATGTTTLVVDSGTLYVLGGTPSASIFSLYALDTRTGKARWSRPIKQAQINEQLLLTNALVYLVGSSGQVSAVKRQNGQLLWQGQLQASSEVLLSRIVLLDNHLFAVTESLQASKPAFFIHAFNITTHREDWYANITGVEISGGSVANLSA